MTRLINILTLVSFLLAWPLSAQIDSNESTATTIPAIESESGSSGSTLDIKPIDNTGLSTPTTNRINGMSVPDNSSLNTDKKEFSMFGEKFGNPGELYEKQLKKQAESVEKKLDESMTGNTTDQYLGDYKTKVSEVNIVYRDHGAVDGDLIRIFVDDDVVKPQILLVGSFKGFKLSLVNGFNKIDFQALNQGESGPNTAQVMVLDLEGNIIASSHWNLATGVKATLIVVKE